MSEVNTPAVLERGLHVTSKAAQRLRNSMQPTGAFGAFVSPDPMVMGNAPAAFDLILELTLIYGEHLSSVVCGPFLLTVRTNDYNDNTNIVGAAREIGDALRSLLQDQDPSDGSGRTYIQNMTREDLTNLALFDATASLSTEIYSEINKHRQRLLPAGLVAQHPEQVTEAQYSFGGNRVPVYINEARPQATSRDPSSDWSFGQGQQTFHNHNDHRLLGEVGDQEAKLAGQPYGIIPPPQGLVDMRTMPAWGRPRQYHRVDFNDFKDDFKGTPKAQTESAFEIRLKIARESGSRTSTYVGNADTKVGFKDADGTKRCASLGELAVYFLNAPGTLQVMIGTITGRYGEELTYSDLVDIDLEPGQYSNEYQTGKDWEMVRQLYPLTGTNAAGEKTAGEPIQDPVVLSTEDLPINTPEDRAKADAILAPHYGIDPENEPTGQPEAEVVKDPEAESIESNERAAVAKLVDETKFIRLLIDDGNNPHWIVKDVHEALCKIRRVGIESSQGMEMALYLPALLAKYPNDLELEDGGKFVRVKDFAPTDTSIGDWDRAVWVELYLKKFPLPESA